MQDAAHKYLYRYRQGENLGPASAADCALSDPVFHVNAKVSNRTGILLVHGFTSNPYSMHMLAQAAKDHAFQTLVPILPWHDNGPAAMADVQYIDWVQAVEAAYIKLRQNCDKVVIVGQSLGAVLAALVAVKFKNVDQLILLVPSFYPPKMLKLARYIKPLLQLFGKHYLNSIAGNVKREQQYELTYERIHLNFFVELNKVCSIGRKALKHITAPTCFVGSAGDMVVAERGVKTAYAQCGSANKEYVSLKNSYHLVALDNDLPIVQDLMLSAI